MKLKRKEQPVNDSDEEFSVDSEGFVKNRGEVKSSRSSKSLSNYLEASSDDEFAKEHFILPSASDDEDQSGKKRKRKGKDKGKEKGKDDSDGEADKIDYRIQFILGKSVMPQKEWRKITDGINTRELTKFSVWQQPDEEYYDDSDVPVEKFLIKWAHASFLHVSWETEKDLVDMVGTSARHHIKKFRLREFEGTELFEDLSKGEYYPQSFIQIERVLDVDDPEVNMLEVDWENSTIPPIAKPSIPSESSGEDLDYFDSADADENKSGQCKQPRKKRKVSKKSKMNYLHSDNVWLTVKWEGLPYSEVSFESLQDLISRGIEYERPLRFFFRREQKQFDIKSKKDRKAANRNLIVDQTVIGSDSTPPKFPAGELRDYQWEGVRWMLFNLVQGRNCILADEMGLGKTIQSAALLQMIKNHSQNSGPFLVIAPLSTIVNWQREINGWTNLDVILYYGSQEDRDLIRSYEFRFLDKNCQGNKIEVLITTPETCVAVDDKSTTRIRRELSSIDWDLVIIDEAHKLKNYDSKLASTLREEYSFKNCVLLTGTPLQNNTEELWNLLNFIARDDFNDRESFIENFGELKTATQLEKLHKRIKPYLLRREKEFVEKSVPPKEEIVVEVELTVPQKQYYRAIYEQKTGFLYKQGGKDGPSLSNLAMELRKCCNHPFLIKGAAVEISKHFKNDSAIDVLVKTSGKMTLLDKLLPKLFHDGHRVLIFSQFRMMLDIIEDYIHAKGYFYDRVDGSIVGKKRQAAIDRFSNNDNVFIMLLSTKAGGVGINLTAADTVIIFDSDWNPQNDVQAQARAHRIGQTKPVTVYRLLTKKTYEMVMFRAASIKLGLDYAVMHNLKGSVEVTALPTVTTGKTRRAAAASGLAGISAERAEHVSSLSKRELENLLKHGAYDMFLEEKEGTSENESRFFVESSIEQILEKSSTFLHRENDSQVQCTKTSSFAKASFISATGGDSTNDGEEVAIDDPDFWTKVVGLSVEDAEIQLGAKRKCRQFTESYREPTDSIKSIYGSHQAAYVTDSDESTAEEKGGKRKKRRKAEPEIVSAEFTADNLNAVLLAAVGYGYGNWKLIRKHSKMYWKDEDLAKAARIGMLFLLLAVSIQSEASAGAKSTNEDANNSEEVEDAEKENVCEEGNLTPADVATSNVEERSIRFENKVILATINKYRAIKLALKVYFDNFKTSSVDASKIEDNYLIQFKTFLESKQLEQVTVKALKESYQEFLQLSFDTVESIDNLVIELTKDELVQKLLSNEKELTKTAKKAALKAKMTVLEDLYECKLFDKIVNRKVAACLPISMEKKMDDEDEEYVEPVIDRKKDINTELFASEFETLTTANDTPSWWSTYYDSQALAIVSECGWPDSKKRFAMIVESLKANAIPGSAEEKEVEQQNLALEEAKIQQKLEKERQKAKERELEKELIEEDKMDVVATEPTDQTKNPEPDAAVAVVAIPKTAFDLLTSKFLLQRLKILTRHFRCTDEDQSALEKAAAKAEKSLAAAKNAEKNLRKKNVTNLLKTIQRIGYPRSTYENIPQPERVVDSSYLLNWENFIKDADITLTIDEAKEITYEAIDVFNRLDEYKDKEVIMEDGLLADIPVKLIEPTFEKTELVHQIRLLLSFHSEIEIVDFIRENCKVTGPNIPTYKRDTNMPVWWTQQQHDIQLLKLSIQNGCSQWKKVASEDVFAYPEGYVIPPKVNGQEWVTQVNPKALEKRIFAILRGVPSIKSFPTAPPSSPQKKIAANSKNAIVAAPSVKNVWFKKSEPSGSVASLAKVVTPIPPSPIVATPVRETVVVPIDIISSEAKVVPSQPKEVISIDEDEPILVEQVTPAHEETALSIVSNHNTPTNFIESLQSITESDLSIKEVEQMKVEEKEKTLDNITVLEIDIDQTKAKENSTTVVPATPVTPQATVSTEPPKTEAKKAKQAASSNPSENAGKGKKGKTEVKPPVQSKGIMHFFAKK